MRWPWRRANDDDAHVELERAQQELARVRDQWEDVQRLSAWSVEFHRRNHIAEKLHLIYTGRKP